MSECDDPNKSGVYLCNKEASASDPSEPKFPLLPPLKHTQYASSPNQN